MTLPKIGEELFCDGGKGTPHDKIKMDYSFKNLKKGRIKEIWKCPKCPREVEMIRYPLTPEKFPVVDILEEF